MIKKVFLATFLIGLSLILVGCQSTEQKFQENEMIEASSGQGKELNIKDGNENDPLGLFGDSNLELEECFKMVNPDDPLGIMGEETDQQKTQREECLDKYGK